MGSLIADSGPWVILALLGAYHGINPGMGWLFAVALGLQEQRRAAVVRAFAPIALGHAASIAAVFALVAALQTVVSPTLLRMIGASLLFAYGLYKLFAPMTHPRWVGMRVGFRDLTVWSFLMATAHGAGLMLVPILLKLPSGEKATPPVAPMAAPATGMIVPASMAFQAGLAPMVLEQITPEAEPYVTSNTHDGDHKEHSEHHEHSAVSEHSDHAQHLQKAGISGPVAGIGAIALHTGAMFLTMAIIALIVYEKIGLTILRRAWVNLDLLWAVALIGAGFLSFFV